MRGVGFDYANTCPRIDRAIDGAKDTLRRHIETILEEACPLLQTGRLQELAEQYAESLYADLEDAFEEARSSNIDMRNEAENQIVRLQNELSDLEADIEHLKREAA